jgi:quercetin dioxygenase-like cupin family protein
MKTKCSLDSIPWSPHHFAQGVRIKPMITQKEDRLDVTCLLVDVPVGVEVPEHVHETQDDILYPLSGKGIMWIDGEGEFTLEPGLIIRVPKGTKHKITHVTEALLIYDVFCPALI